MRMFVLRYLRILLITDSLSLNDEEFNEDSLHFSCFIDSDDFNKLSIFENIFGYFLHILYIISINFSSFD